jgi:hypothetical protein
MIGYCIWRVSLFLRGYKHTYSDSGAGYTRRLGARP